MPESGQSEAQLRMNLSGTSETYRAALEERREKEMDQVEQWIDTTQAQLYKSINEDGRRRSSFLMSEDCMDNINMIIKEYELQGFRKRRIQEEMEDVAAKNPFSGSKFGTLREKHNTFMNFIFAIELRQREKKQREIADRRTQTDRQLELDRQIEAEKKAEAERDEAERLEAERRERERKEAEVRHLRWRGQELEQEVDAGCYLNPPASDLSGNPLELSEDKRNHLSGHFIGSIYVGGEEESWTDRQAGEKSSSWRVRL